MGLSRIGNVAGIVLKPADTASAEAALRVVESDMRQIFVDVRCVDAARGPIGLAGPLQASGETDGLSTIWESAISKIAEDRVLLATADASRYGTEVLLALTAWPEKDAVLLGEDCDGEAIAGIFRREPVLEALRHPGIAAYALEVERLDLAALGIDLVSSDPRPGASPAAPQAGGR